MIESHWKLERRPFANTPDPAFVYRSPAFAEAFARLLYDATELRGGLSLITGEIGCGKTMLAQALAERLAGSACDVIPLTYPKITPSQMLATVARGYAILQHDDGRIVRSVLDATPGDRLDARLTDGQLRVRVENP